MKVQRNSWLLEADCSARGLDCTLDYSTRQWYQGDDKSAYPYYCCCCCCDSCVGGILKACSTLCFEDSAEQQNTNRLSLGTKESGTGVRRCRPKDPQQNISLAHVPEHIEIFRPAAGAQHNNTRSVGGGKRWMTLFTLKQRSVWSRGRIEPCKFIHE